MRVAILYPLAKYTYMHRATGIRKLRESDLNVRLDGVMGLECFVVAVSIETTKADGDENNYLVGYRAKRWVVVVCY